MKLSEMRQILTEHGLQLTKSLGQNFLHDQNQLQRIVAAAELQPGDRVLEIGPGLGPLTELLVERAGEVLAIEMDRRLAELLAQRFTETKNLKLECADAVDYLRKHRDWAGWKLVANLPYSSASPMLVELAEADKPPQIMVATLQAEVARRIDARAGDDHFGLLSLLLQLRYESRGWFNIPATCFFPEPEVGSACVILKLRPEPLLPANLEPAFKRLVKRALSQRRKMMLKLLKADYPLDRLHAAFAEIGLSPQIRAEKVTLEQFVILTRLLNP